MSTYVDTLQTNTEACSIIQSWPCNFRHVRDIENSGAIQVQTLHFHPSYTLYPSLPTLLFKWYLRVAGRACVSGCIRLIIGKQIANTYSTHTHTHTHTHEVIYTCYLHRPYQSFPILPNTLSTSHTESKFQCYHVWHYACLINYPYNVILIQGGDLFLLNQSSRLPHAVRYGFLTCESFYTVILHQAHWILSVTEAETIFIRMVSSGMLRRVARVRTDVSEELSASFIRVTRIGELGKALAVTSNRRTLRAPET
jgi:hypothetical protein